MNERLNRLRNAIYEFANRERSLRTLRAWQSFIFLATFAILSFLLVLPLIKRQSVSLGVDGAPGEIRVGVAAERSLVADRQLYYENGDAVAEAEAVIEKEAPRLVVRDRNTLRRHLDAINNEFARLARFRPPGLENPATLGIATAREVRANTDYKLLKSLSDADLVQLARNPTRETVRRLSEKIIKLLFEKYAVLPAKVSPDSVLDREAVMARTINSAGDETPQQISAERVISAAQMGDYNVRRGVINLIRKRSKAAEAELSLAYRLAAELMQRESFAEYSPEMTELYKRDLIKNRKRELIPIREGEFIFRTGETVSRETVWKIEAYNGSIGEDFEKILAIVALQGVFAFVILRLFRQYNRDHRGTLASIVIVFSLLWSMGLGTFFMEYWYQSQLRFSLGSGGRYLISEIFPFGVFVPSAVLTILIAMLFGDKLALAMALYLSFYVLVASRFDEFSFVISLTTSVAVSIGADKIRRRLDFYKLGTVIFAIQSVVVLAWYMHYRKNYQLLPGVIVCNLLVSFCWALLAAALSNLYEIIFNQATAFRLRELADLSHPLLREMAVQAPSTYQHTLMVANLSEAAVRAIHGNELLTRVGCYFHDIGKTPNAGFYVENQHLIPKPEYAGKLGPIEAARRVIDHVLDGIQLARRYRLPQAVIDFIPEHHGTSTMAYFYHAALSKNPAGAAINRENFRYPGPRPRSRETAVVMLADSLEAASRTLENATREDISRLVEKIINGKMEEHQLDLSGLTLGELNDVKNIFIDILVSAQHFRPRYPTAQAIQKLENRQDSSEPAVYGPKGAIGGLKALPAARGARGRTGKSGPGRKSG